MSTSPESTPEYPEILHKMSAEMSSAFQQELPTLQHMKLPDLIKYFETLPRPVEQVLRRYVLLNSDRITNPTENRKEREAIMRGALFTLALVRFIEDREELRAWFEQTSLIDDGGVVVQPPSGELGDDRSVGPLFLAPPDPEPHPEA